MPWPRRARAALAIGGGLVAALSGCGGDDPQPTAAAPPPPPPKCAPALYEAIRNEVSYPDDAVARAREGRFNLRKVHLKLKPPIDWDQNPIDSTAFQGKLQDLTWIDPLLFAYWRGDTKALAQARDIVLDWIRSNPFSNPYSVGHVRGDSKPWIDKVSASRAPIIAYVAKAARCEGLLSPAQDRALHDSLLVHGSFLANPDNYHLTNHGLYVDQGLDLLSQLAPSLPPAGTWAKVADKRFLANLRSHIAGNEGFWLEHSAQYQVAITRLVERFIQFGQTSRELKRLALRMRKVTAYMLEPDGQLVLYGDSNLISSTPGELELADRTNGAEWLPRTGLAFVRRQEPPAYLSVYSSFHSDAHKDADELSFDLFDSGRRIVTDSGLYHKDFDRYFAYENSPQAHSVLEAGTGVPIVDSNSYGSGLEARGKGGGWYAVLGRNPLLEQAGVGHERIFLYRPGYALIVVDRVRSERPHPIERHFQIAPGIGVEADGDVLRLTDDGLDATLTSTASAPERVDLDFAQHSPLSGFEFPNFREAVPRYTATFKSHAADLDAVATFGLDPDQQVSAKVVGDSTADATAVRVQDSAGADLGTILVTRDGEHLGVAVSSDLAGEPIG